MEILTEEIAPTGTITHSHLGHLHVNKHIQDFYKDQYLRCKCNNDTTSIKQFLNGADIFEITPAEANMAEALMTIGEVRDFIKSQHAS